MSGMHDVAVLTKRYNDLHESSLKLKRVVQKLQKDVSITIFFIKYCDLNN